MADRRHAVGEPADDPSPAGHDRAARLLATRTALVAGLGLHLVVGAFVAPVGQVAPAGVALLLGLLWVAVAVGIVRCAPRRPLLTLLLPFGAAAGWWVVVAWWGG